MQACRLTLGEHQTSLADAAQAYLGIELDKTSQTTDWSVEHLTLAQIEYAARDAVACWRIFRQVMPALGAQEPAYEIQMTAIPAVVRMELRGFRLDTDAHARMIEDLRRERVAIDGRVRQGVRRLRPCSFGWRTMPSTPNEKTSLLKTLLTQAELDGWTRTKKSGRPLDQAQRPAPRGALSAHRRPDQAGGYRQAADLLRRHAGGQGLAGHGPHPCLATKSPAPLPAAHPVPAQTSSRSRATSVSAPCSCQRQPRSWLSPTIPQWNCARRHISPAIPP